MELLWRRARWFHELRVDRNSDIITNHPWSATYSEIHPINVGRSGNTHVQVASRIFKRLRRAIDIQDCFFGYAMNCEIAGNFELSLPGWFNALGFERDGWIFLYVQEVIATQIVITHLNARIN